MASTNNTFTLSAILSASFHLEAVRINLSECNCNDQVAPFGAGRDHIESETKPKRVIIRVVNILAARRTEIEMRAFIKEAKRTLNQFGEAARIMHA
jgi:hypothetical protein